MSKMAETSGSRLLRRDFAVRLPPGARGALTLDLIALDSGECKLAQATLGEMVPQDSTCLPSTASR